MASVSDCSWTGWSIAVTSSNVYSFADRRARLCDGQAARLPQGARQGAGVESGENAAQRLPATRDAAYRKEVGALPPALPPSLVATIAACPAIRIDGRQVYLLGRMGVCWADAIGWRWAASIGAPPHDIWNQAFTDALEGRAGR